MRKIILILLVSFAGFPTSHASPCEEALGRPTAQQLKSQAEATLGFKLKISARQSAAKNQHYIVAKDPSGNQVAELYYSYIGDVGQRNEIEVVGMFVDIKYRQLGLSNLLLARLFQFNPAIVKLEAEFQHTNERVIKEARRRGADLESAMRETPFYKSVAKFGFTNIETMRSVPFYVMVVSKE